MPTSGPDELTFWNLRDERDYPLLLELNRGSRQADQDEQPVTLEMIADTLTRYMDGLTAQQGVVIAALGGAPVGYSRLGWYSSRPETRLYYQVSFLPAVGRARGLWPELAAENERRLRAVAAEHPPVREAYLQAWARDNQRDWMAVLEQAGYQAVRRFNNMLYTLGKPPVRSLPAGLELRPATPERMRAVWEAQREMNAGLFENVADDWLEPKYPGWLADPRHTPQLWQLAWAGDELAGMVLTHINEQENRERGRRRGYTEHIYVRPVWRGRGLASALIARSLQVLKDAGMTEAELGVDAQNESAAFRLYTSLGYRTFSVDTWYRKPLAGQSPSG